jgi:uncharacterized membrane-anchored protein YhcB (DUF1043 family)
MYSIIFAQNLSHTTQKSSQFNQFAQTIQKLSHLMYNTKGLFNHFAQKSSNLMYNKKVSPFNRLAQTKQKTSH